MSSAQIVSASSIPNRTNATMFAGTPGIVSSPAPAHTMFSGGQAAAAGGSPVLIKQGLAKFTANPQMVKSLCMHVLVLGGIPVLLAR